MFASSYEEKQSKEILKKQTNLNNKRGYKFVR
jgi:hypothetical protein